MLSPVRTAPSSPRLCVIPPTPTSSVNPLSMALAQKVNSDDRSLPIMGPRFPKSKMNKKGKKRQVVVIPTSDNQKPYTHRRQYSAPFDVVHHTPYKRQNSTKSLVTDLSDLRHLLEQEDMRRSPGSPGSSRFMKAIRHLPKKVNALRGRLQSDDSDLDTISCSSTKSLDMRRKTQKRNSNDSVTAALIRSIMMDPSTELSERRGLSRVVEGEETAVSAPATPKLNLYSSTSEIELGGAKELIHQISSDMEESIAFIESSNASSSCDSSMSGDEVTDSSAMGLKDEDNSIVDDFDLQEEKADDDNSSVSAAENAVSDIQSSPGKTTKGRVTFVFGCNEMLTFKGGRHKSRSLSPKSRKSPSEIFRKNVSLSPILVKSSKNQSCQSPKMLSDSTSSSLSSSKQFWGNFNVESSSITHPELDTDLSTRSSSSSPMTKPSKKWNSSMPKMGEPLQSSNPFDQEFNAATIAIQTAPGALNIEDLPQPFESAKLSTPPNSAASISVSPPFIQNFAYISDYLHRDVVASASLCSSSSACMANTIKVDELAADNMKAEDSNQKLPLDLNSIANSPTLVLPLLDKSQEQNISTNVVLTNLEENPTLQPKEHKLQANVSMDSSSDISDVKMALKKSVSDNPVCSLTLDTPRVLSPLHKSRSTTSLVCRHEAATASHFATDGEREGTSSLAHEEDRTVYHGPSSHLSTAALKHSQSPAKLSAPPAIHRRSSDSDLSVTPKGKTKLKTNSCYRHNVCTFIFVDWKKSVSVPFFHLYLLLKLCSFSM